MCEEEELRGWTFVKKFSFIRKNSLEEVSKS